MSKCTTVERTRAERVELVMKEFGMTAPNLERFREWVEGMSENGLEALVRAAEESATKAETLTR